MRFKANTFGVTIGLLALVAACSKTPSGILPEKKMQAVLTDMQIAEAMIGVDYKAYQDSGYKEALYESVFRKHKIRQEVYDSSLVWYGKHIDIYVKMHDRIRTDLDQRIKALGNVQASTTTSTRTDSVDIWPRRPYLLFKDYDLYNGVNFDLQPSPNYPSGSRFVLGMRVWGIRPDMKHTPEIRLTVVQPDTTITINKRIAKDGYHELELRSMPTRQVRRVYGFIRMDNADSDYHIIYTDSINLMRYNYRSDFSVVNDTTAVLPADSLITRPMTGL